MSLWPAIRSRLGGLADRLAPGPSAAALSRLAEAQGPYLWPYRTPSGFSTKGPKQALLFTICILIGMFFGFFVSILPYFLYPLLAIPIVILLLLVIWVLPDNPRSSFTWSARLAFGFFLSLGLWPNYMSFYVPGFPWLSLRRLFSIPLLFTFLFFIAANSSARRHIVEVIARYRAFSIAFIAFCFSQFASLFMAPHLINPINRYLINQVSWTVPFFVFLLMFRDEAYIRRFMIAIACTGVALGLLGIVEYELQRVIWAAHIPSFLKVDVSQIQAVLYGSYREGMYRTIGIWSDTLSFAEYLSVSIVFLLYMLFSAKTPARVAALVVVDVMMLVSIYFTGARLGLFGALLAHLLFAFGWAYNRWSRDRQDLIAPAVLLLYPAGLVAACAAVLFVGRVRGAFIGNGAQDASDSGRIEQFAKAPALILRRALFGYGPGEGGLVLDYHQPGGLLTVDSYILTASLDYGIIGFLGFFGMMLICVFYGMRAFMSGPAKGDLGILTAVVALSVYMIIRLVLSQEENQPLLFMFMALLLAMVHAAVPKNEKPANRTRSRK